jgi:hypothetical protein
MRVLVARRRWLPVLVVLLAVVGVAASWISGRGEADTRPQRLGERQLQRLADRVEYQALERNGIYVTSSGVDGEGARRCVHVSLLNPTSANRAFVRARYGPGVCPDRQPAGAYAVAGVGCGAAKPKPDAKTVTVPDVRGLPPYLAVRRLQDLGLSTCNDSGPNPPSRYAAENVLRVRTQDPPAGTTVQLPRIFALQSVGYLPGGFRMTASVGN